MSEGHLDALVVLGRSRYGGPVADVESVAATARDLGIATTVCVTAWPSTGSLGDANRRLRALTEESRGRLVALTRVDPYEPEGPHAAAELLAAGARGIFVHPWEEHFRVTDRRLTDGFMAVAREHGAPVYVEAGFPWVSETAQVGELVRRYPDVTVIATRGNQMNMSGLAGGAAATALVRNPNLHYLTSGIYRQDWLEETVSTVGTGRFLYASMAPAFDARLEWKRARLAAAAAPAVGILGAAARRLLRL